LKISNALLSKKIPQLSAIFISAEAGMDMEFLQEAQLVKGKGIIGDRYFNNDGYWQVTEACQVTLISQKDVLISSKRAKQSVVSDAILSGQHRRNLVVDDLDIKKLIGKRFGIGEVVFSFKRQRPPCGYIDQISYKDMCRSLGKNSGCCIDVIEGGRIKIGDPLFILS